MGKRGIFLDKKAQITLFVILAVLIVVGVLLYFFLRSPVQQEIPQQFRTIYNNYISCIQENARQGIALLGEQGGYINKPAFVPGSSYMPFSSELDFLGQGVPYWMYVSGNNLLKEQVPKKSSMEKELANYIKARINYCDFSEFNLQGYDALINEDPSVSVSIKDAQVDVVVKNNVAFYFGNESVIIKSHSTSIDSKLGKFYNLALSIYNYEKKNVFLEKYALDVMRLYAPVDGSEIGCKPKIFNDNDIKQNISNGLEANIASLKLNGDYYTLKSKQQDYFVTNIGENVDENINFLYSKNMPTRIEIYGDRVVQPIGMQSGMAILGFCYTPYHLVYDINFPVLIQIYNENDIFQFPIAVVIQRNKERQSFDETAESVDIETPVCRYKNQNVKVSTYDSQLNPLEADLRFKCLTTECSIGSSSLNEGEAVYEGNFPQCTNGFILASKEGYADTKYQISTNEESSADIILSKKYNLDLDLGEVESALVTFESDDFSTTVVYPDTKNIELIEGYYNVSVYVYRISSLRIPAYTDKKCVQVPKSSILGVLGSTEEKCFDLTMPEQNIDSAIVGGGKTREYITENQLSSGRILAINIPLFKTPSTLQELQDNYIKLDDSIVFVDII